MSVFSVQIDKLNLAADKYTKIIADIDNQKQNYTALIQEIDNSWDGLASISYINRMKGQTTKLTNMRKYVVALRKYCKDTAERMEFIDKMLRKLMEMVSSIWGNNSSNSNTTHGGGGAQIPNNDSTENVVQPIDESVYDQTAYSQFMEHYDYDYDGDVDYINTGCVITSCAYALTRMGIETTPLQAYERSGGCYAYYNKISQNQAKVTTNCSVSLIDEMARKAKNDPNNISPLMLRVNGNTHTVGLKDIEMDSAGKITKYIVFDPYKATTKEYTSISQMKVSSFNYYTRS